MNDDATEGSADQREWLKILRSYRGEILKRVTLPTWLASQSLADMRIAADLMEDLQEMELNAHTYDHTIDRENSKHPFSED